MGFFFATPCLIYIDSNAGAQVLTKGGPNRSSIRHQVGALWLPAVRNPLNVWRRWVSSASNPADAPIIGGTPEEVAAGDQGGVSFSTLELCAWPETPRWQFPPSPPPLP